MIKVFLRCLALFLYRSVATGEPCDSFLKGTCPSGVAVVSESCHATRAYIATRQVGSPYVLVFTAFTEGFGSLLGSLRSCYQAADYLGLTFYIDFKRFPEFPTILEPRTMDLSLSHSRDFVKNAPFGSQLLQFADGFIVSPPLHLRRISSLISKLPPRGVSMGYFCREVERALSPLYPEKQTSAACFFHTFFRPSQLAQEQVTAALGPDPVDPLVWHVRTPEGEPSAYNFTRSQFHVLIDEIPVLCSMYHNATHSLLVKDQAYVTGNSLQFRTQCHGTKPSGGHLEGLQGLHTQTNRNSRSRIAVMIDFLMIVRAKYLVFTSTTMTSMAMTFAQYNCAQSSASSMLIRGRILVCTMKSLFTFQDIIPGTDFKPSDHPLLPFVPVAAPCPDPIWCNYTVAQVQAIEKWQSQDCNTARLMLYDPMNYGVGSMLHIAGVALRAAMCYNRMLVLDYYRETFWKPMSFKCDRTPLECYFLPISPCAPDKSWADAPILNHTTARAVANERVVRLVGHVPNNCGFCGTLQDFPFEEPLTQAGLERTQFKRVLQVVEAPLMAATVRYIMRPQPWLRSAVRHAVQQLPSIPRPFASVHIRYGDKVIVEAKKVPLHDYMDVLIDRRPDIKSVFVSTETQQVLQQLSTGYPDIKFYALHYNRTENHFEKRKAAEHDFIYSIANLHIAMYADAFVGTLSSNWCRLILEMERTRGDSGMDYSSVDVSSQMASCFGI